MVNEIHYTLRPNRQRPDAKLGRDRPPPAIPSSRNSFGRLTYGHRTRAAAVKQHSILGPEIGKFFEQQTRRDMLGDGQI